MAVTEAYDASPLSEKFRNINLIPFHESDRKGQFGTNYVLVQDRLTHNQLQLLWNPTPLQATKGFICIVATTTKIRTGEKLRTSSHWYFIANSTPFYSVNPKSD